MSRRLNESERDAVEALVREAAELVMQVYAEGPEVEYKSPRDPVTKADKLANAHIVAGLKSLFPEDGIVAEESVDASEALKSDRVWFVDPLDGTKEFIAKNGEFAVMVGAALNGESIFGCVYQPVKDKMYIGVSEEFAILRSGGETRELNVSAKSEPATLALVVSRSHRAATVDEIANELNITTIRPSGSVGLKVGLIAEQEADFYVHLSDRSSLWDSCGPEAILRGAGGIFKRGDGSTYDYRTTDLRTRGGILACNGAAYEAVLPTVTRVAQASGILDSLKE